MRCFLDVVGVTEAARCERSSPTELVCYGLIFFERNQMSKKLFLSKMWATGLGGIIAFASPSCVPCCARSDSRAVRSFFRSQAGAPARTVLPFASRKMV